MGFEYVFRVDEQNESISELRTNRPNESTYPIDNDLLNRNKSTFDSSSVIHFSYPLRLVSSSI